MDDNEINIKLGKKVFERLGYDVKTAFDGKEAVELCRVNYFDIIFMDLKMPVMDGFEATEIINQTKKKFSDRPLIIAMTANETSETREKCKKLGMVDFMSKPIDILGIKDKILAIVNYFNHNE